MSDPALEDTDFCRAISSVSYILQRKQAGINTTVPLCRCLAFISYLEKDILRCVSERAEDGENKNGATVVSEMANLIFLLSCKAYHESWFLSWTSNYFPGRCYETCVFFYLLLGTLKGTFFICSFLYCIICSSLHLFHAKIFYWAST